MPDADKLDRYFGCVWVLATIWILALTTAVITGIVLAVRNFW